MFIVHYVVPKKPNQHRGFLIYHSLLEYMDINEDDHCIEYDFFLELYIDLPNTPIDDSNKIITIQYHMAASGMEILVFTPY